MSMLTRTPKGTFLWQGEALYTWLPVLLEKACGSALETMLDGGVGYCEKEIAACHRIFADELITKPSRGEPLPTWHMLRAEKWSKRRDVLLVALRAIREIK